MLIWEELASDPRIIRGNELQLGEFDSAEFENFAVGVGNQWRCCKWFSVGKLLFRPRHVSLMIFAARQVLTIAGLDEHTEIHDGSGLL